MHAGSKSKRTAGATWADEAAADVIGASSSVKTGTCKFCKDETGDYGHNTEASGQAITSEALPLLPFFFPELFLGLLPIAPGF